MKANFPAKLYVNVEQDGDEPFFPSFESKSDAADGGPREVATYELVEVQNLELRRSTRVYVAKEKPENV